MKFCCFALLWVLSNSVYSQSTTDANKNAQTKEDLQKLWNGMQDAAAKKDRKALETYYADEFIFIHSSGQEDNKQRRIDNILSIIDYTKAPMVER